MKTCIKCKQTKELTEFYVHKQMADGHLGKCKECVKKYQSERLQLKKNDYEWVKKERERCREKAKKARECGCFSKVSNEVRKRWRLKNKIKINAQQKASRAVAKGIIKVLTECEECGSKGKLQKHHDDYSNPLSVRFLCSKCHGIQHRISD